MAGVEARQSYRSLVVALGEPAHDPAGASTAEAARAPTAPGAFEAAPTRTGTGLRVPPAPATLAATPSWAMHAWGIERKRADTIRRACSYARRLEEAAEGWQRVRDCSSDGERYTSSFADLARPPVLGLVEPERELERALTDLASLEKAPA